MNKLRLSIFKSDSKNCKLYYYKLLNNEFNKINENNSLSIKYLNNIPNLLLKF